MEDLIFFAFVASVYNSKSIWSMHSSLLTLDLNQNISSALFQSYGHIIAAYDLSLILIALSHKKMAHSVFFILWKECLSAQAKQVMVLYAIQKLICCICYRWFLDNYDPTIGNRKGADLVINVSNFFIIDIIKRLSVEISIVFPEILEPWFIIRQNFPLRLPQLLMHSSLVIFVHQDKVKFVVLLIVSGDEMGVLVKR